MFSRVLYYVFLLFTRYSGWVKRSAIILLLAVAAVFIAGKTYQVWDDDPDRGAIAIKDGAFGESYSTPVYLDQGWDANDSLWFYNTTQGSALLPYDFFLALERPESEELFRSAKNMDRHRYLPQKKTFFNPDALPVGIVRDTYGDKDYVGYTCAACHTGQVNYKGKAIRVDGGPAMADMVGFLKELENALEATLKSADEAKNRRFVEKVLALKNDYGSAKEINADLQIWADRIELYNTVNNSVADGRKVEYGHARLDAFGRIYNRVLQHVINREHLADILSNLVSATGRPLLDQVQIANVLADVDDVVLNDDEFALVLKRLKMPNPDYPDLSNSDMLRFRNSMFNSPNAPVSYPFLWDIAQSDYVQWNGLAGNATLGPLGRNAGEVIGVFGILDWQADDRWLGLSEKWRRFSISSFASGQTTKRDPIYFKSSIDLTNLKRLERHLQSLQSPEWPEDILGKIDRAKAKRGKRLYDELCLSCHEVIDRSNRDRKVVAKMFSLKKAGTDKAMAENSVKYTGKSGNFMHTYQSTDVGTVLLEEEAPVAAILTAATKGVVTTPDPDKWFIRRWADWLYTVAGSLFDNEIKASMKAGNYDPDTTAEPFRSLLSYKARSLNGIWATAPYLHNGSVPTLYDLLLPVNAREGCPKARPVTFKVGAREFDPVKVGFRYEGYDGFEFRTELRGNGNAGHEYRACKMTDDERWDLVEYLKTL